MPIQFKPIHALVIGDVMLDRYVTGETSRISPEAPVPVVRVMGEEARPGGAGNVALNLAALGARVDLIALTGDDSNASVLEKECHAVNVTPHFVKSPTHPTIVKQRVLSQHQQLLRLDYEAPFEAVSAEKLLPVYKNCLKHADVVVLSDYNKGALTHTAKECIALARKHNIPVLVDPKQTDFSDYKGATLVTPNFKEFQAVVGSCAAERDVIERGQALLSKHQLAHLLVTRGEAGMTLLMPNEPECYFAARGREVFDVTGAGDTVISVIAMAYASGYSMPFSVKLGNMAAGIVIGKLGAATLTVADLERALEGRHSQHSGVLSEEALMFELKEARARGEKVVFTNGCFDVLHALHVEYLQMAKALGDRLIVGVNDDASITKLKGEGRPVNKLEQRMAVLAGLQSVDWVVPFSDDTPERLLALLKPEVLAKGGDYTVDQVVGASIVKAYGGDVVVLGDVIDGVKSTAIIERIKQLVRE